MDFLNSPEVIQEAIRVMKAEITVLQSQIPDLETQLSETRALLSEEPFDIQRRLQAGEILVNALTIQAEKDAHENSFLTNEINALQDTVLELEQFLEKNSTSGDDSGCLASRLESYIEKSKKLQQRISSWATKNKRLEDEISNMTEEKEGIEQRITEQNYQYLQAITTFPRIFKYPSVRDLYPIAHAWESLDGVLHGAGLDSYVGHSHYHPERLVWRGYHGITFFPKCNVDAPIKREYDLLFNKVDGRSYHIFHRRKSFIYYQGLYRLRRLKPHYFTDVSFEHRNFVIIQALEALLPFSNTRADTQVVERLVIDGVISFDCLVLQCLGFDEKMYSALVQHFKRIR